MATPSTNVSTHVAEFSPTDGLPLGKDQRAMTFLYGMSDFWVSMFQDPEILNVLIEGNSFISSEIYNKFLQLSSGICLDDVQVSTNSQIKLVLLASSAAVQGEVETYDLPEKISEARCIANRALLPTSTLEEGVDFYIDYEAGVNGQIRFARPLASSKMVYRVLADGSREYALWFIDAKIDEDLIYEHFAKFIGVNQPERSTENFKNLVYGLYYLYTNGPNLDLMRRGLNLALGIPLARDDETVLEIRKYPNTDQWLVIADSNSYLIPYGLEPSVAEGDVLSVGEELASWVEVKDYVNDGDWWINYMIPAKLLPHVPNDDPSRNRYATEGSYADWIMRNYLKNHTFLVNVRTVGFRNIQSFEQLSDIIKSVKPTHTTPIYVWTVPTATEELILEDDLLEFYKNDHRCEVLTTGIARFIRGATNPLRRECPQFTRKSVPAKLMAWLGQSPEINGQVRFFNGGYTDGYIAPNNQFGALTTEEEAWQNVFARKGNQNFLPTKSKIKFLKRDRTIPYAGTSTDWLQDRFPGMRAVLIYNTTQTDAINKFATIGRVYDTTQYINTLFEPEYTIDAINEHAINEAFENSFYDFMLSNFNTYFQRANGFNYLGPFAAIDSYKSFTPNPADLKSTDYLAFVNVLDYFVGVFWITSNFTVQAPAFYTHGETDQLKMRVSGKMTRGMGPMGSPYYLLRGANSTVGGQTSAINEIPINEEESDSTINVSYTDSFNNIPTVDRSGKGLVTVRTWTN